MSAIAALRPGRVQGAVVVVTGAAKGIGRTYARALAAEGAHVVVADRNGDDARALADALDAGGGPHRSLAVDVDVALEDAAQELVAEVLARLGRVDVLVNNAGSCARAPLQSISHAHWQHVVRENLDSAFLCTKAVVEPMRAAGGGKIVNIASNVVWTGLPEMAPYTAAKAGVVGLTRALARELAPSGITVNALAPGAVMPDALAGEHAHGWIEQVVRYQCVQRPMTAADLVGALLFLASAESDFMTGQVVTVDGGLSMH